MEAGRLRVSLHSMCREVLSSKQEGEQEEEGGETKTATAGTADAVEHGALVKWELPRCGAALVRGGGRA